MSIAGITGIVSIGIALVCCFLRVDKVFYVLVLTAPLTTVAALNIGGSSVLIYHLVWLVMSIKVFVLRLRSVERFKLTWLPFLLFCLANTTLAMISGDTLVLNVDNSVTSVVYSFQQYTQWGYLLIAISTVWFTEYLIRLRRVDTSKMLVAFKLSVAVVIVVAFMQLVLPADFITQYFRNAAHTHYQWEGARISSTFQEPSMLSLFLVPALALIFSLWVKKPTIKDAILCVLILVVCFLNSSSSAVLGVIAMLSIAITISLVRFKRAKYAKTAIISFALLGGVAAFALALGLFDSIFSQMNEKLGAVSQSGVARASSANLMLDVFMNHPIVGVGWGTSRGYDLFTTWLAELGIIGIALFLIPLLRISISLLYTKRNKTDFLRDGIFMFVFVTFVILCVSVNEPFYLPVWIFLGAAECYASDSCAHVLPNYINVKPPRLRQTT